MAMSARNTVCLVSSDASLSNSLKGAFKSAGLTLVTYPSVKQFLSAFEEDAPVGCVIAELRNGLEVLKDLTHGHCIVPVVLLAGGGNLSAVVQAVKAGAFDVVEKPDGLLDSVRRAAAVFQKYQKLFEERVAAAQKIQSLTKREVQVFNLMVQGMPNRKIAEQLGVSPKTLDIHRSNLMFKMEAKTAAELCRANLLDKTNPMLLTQMLG